MSKVEFIGDDAIMFGGVPKNVIVQVTFGNEKTTFPYSAKKSIAALFADIKKIDGAPIMFAPAQVATASRGESKFIPLASIEREDIVRCVRADQRDEGTDVDKLPVLGKEYRIIDIIMKRGVVQFYEVLDDASDTPIRMVMFPNEVELLRKRTLHDKVSTLSTIVKCECGEESALELNGEVYMGQCGNPRCGKTLTKQRAK